MGSLVMFLFSSDLGTPNLNADVVAEGVLPAGPCCAVTVPGLGVVHATHSVLSRSFRTIHVSQLHPGAILIMELRGAFTVDIGGLLGATGAAALAEGFGVSHATHLAASDLLSTMQVVHDHWPAGFLKRSPHWFATVPPRGFVADLPESVAAGLAVPQAMHADASERLLTQQVEQSQLEAGFLNSSPQLFEKPVATVVDAFLLSQF